MAGGGRDFVGQAWLRRGDIVFDLGEDAAMGLLGVGGNQPGAAAGGQETDGTAAAINAALLGGFVEVADQENDALVFFREAGQRIQRLADADVAGNLYGSVEKGDDGVDDDQFGAGGGNDLVERFDVKGQAQERVVVVEVKDEDAVQ